MILGLLIAWMILSVGAACGWASFRGYQNGQHIIEVGTLAVSAVVLAYGSWVIGTYAIG